MVGPLSVNEEKIEELKKQIEIFVSLDATHMSSQEVFGELLKVTRCALLNLSRYNGALFRIRKGKFNYNNITIYDLWAPSPSQSAIGRVNRSGFPILYTCDTIECALRECKIEKDDPFLLIEYRIIEDLIFVNPQYSIRNSNIELDNNQFIYYSLINKFVYNQMFYPVYSKNISVYKKTIAVSEFLLNAPNSNCIMYPSTEGLGMGINYAIFSDLSKKMLEIKNFSLLKLQNINGKEHLQRI